MKDLSKTEKLSEMKDPDSQAIADLSRELESSKKKRKADQFYFIFLSFLIIDASLFVHLVDGMAAIALVALQVPFLLILAKRFDITYVEILFDT